MSALQSRQIQRCRYQGNWLINTKRKGNLQSLQVKPVLCVPCFPAGELQKPQASPEHRALLFFRVSLNGQEILQVSHFWGFHRPAVKSVLMIHLCGSVQKERKKNTSSPAERGISMGSWRRWWQVFSFGQWISVKMRTPVAKNSQCDLSAFIVKHTAY